MLHSGPRTLTAEEERRREEAWHASTAEVIARAGERFGQIAHVIGLGPRASRAFVAAAFEIARQYQTGCMYANYERRTGHPYPAEGRAGDDAYGDAAWSMELTRLRSVVEAERR